MQAQTFPTVDSIITAALAETLGASGSNPTAFQDAALVSQVDVINRTFVNAPYQQEPAFGWEWMEKEGGYNFLTYGSTTLNGALTAASTSIILTSGTNWPTSGRSWIKTTNGSVDYVDHTGHAVATTLTGVTNIGIPHATAEKIEMLYALPSDYGKAIALELNNQRQFIYVKTRHLPTGNTYTTRGAYIVMPEDIGANDAALYYYKKPTTIYTASDATSIATSKALSMDIPTDYQRYAIEMLKAYIYSPEGQDERIPLCKSLAQEALDQALSYNVTTTTSLGLRADY